MMRGSVIKEKDGEREGEGEGGRRKEGNKGVQTSDPV